MMMEYQPNFIDHDMAERFLKVFVEQVEWYPFRLSPKSRKVHHVSGTEPPSVLLILDFLIEELKKRCHVNEVVGIFMNKYNDGSDHCPFHRDQYNTDTFTLSLGEPRDFVTKSDQTKESRTYNLKSGDLYYMSKAFHMCHTHGVPKRARANGTRVSILFLVHRSAPTPVPTPVPVPVPTPKPRILAKLKKPAPTVEAPSQPVPSSDLQSAQ